jgi:predicted nucleic acid-binding protein
MRHRKNPKIVAALNPIDPAKPSTKAWTARCTPQEVTPVARQRSLSRQAQDIILDTNVVLDWLVFEHASGLAVGRAITEGEVRWIVSPPMQEELVDVFGRLLTLPTLMRWSARHAPAMAGTRTWAHAVPAPGPLPFSERLRCTDPDDQCFIDLAIARRTPSLLTRDHALRRLARRARPLGVAVLTPEAWAHTQTA